jgi:hypothetical protein
MSEGLPSNPVPPDLAAQLPAPRFDVEPYRPDGVAPLGGLAVLLGGVLATAAALGVVLGFVGQWFYLIILFPVIAGVLLGAAGRGLVRAGRIRSPAVVGTVAGVGGVAMMFTMHYFSYMSALQKLNWQGPPPISFFQYIDAEARDGVVVAGEGANEFNLGYVGSYLYFALEALLAAGFAFALARGPAQEPFCRSCNTWKKGRTLAGLPNVPLHVAVDAVQSGALLDLLETGVPLGGGYNTQFLKLFACPRCGGEGTVVAAVETATTDSRGRRATRLLGRTIYPGEMLARVGDHSPDRRPLSASQPIPKGTDNLSLENPSDDVRPA